MSTTLLDVKGLKKYFPIEGGLLKKTVGHVKAVDDVSFSIYKGETLGIVGESGCGKSTMGRLVLNLIEPTEGDVTFEGTNLKALGKKETLKTRREMQCVFQDPFASLNPRMTVGFLI